MNELPTLPDQGAPAGAAHPAPAPAPAPVKAAPGASILDILQRPLTACLIALAVLFVAHVWTTSKQMRKLREETALRLQKADVVNMETNTLVKTLQENQKELLLKVGVLDSRQSEAQSQQMALEQLYQDLSKNRDEWALAEIEQVLSTASQQLQLAGNVQGALIALQNADRTLSRSDKPQFITIRRAISADTEKLKSLPNLDQVGVALRLDSAIALVDTLPMLADEKPTLPAPPVKPARVKPAKPGAATAATAVEKDSTWVEAAQDVWQRWSSEMWDDVRQLIRVRKVGTPDALMLSPSEAHFIRENVKLRLLNARLALLARNDTAFRSDLSASQEALDKYFDTKAKQTQSLQGLLRQVQTTNLAIELPTLAESLNAVRNYKAKP